MQHAVPFASPALESDIVAGAFHTATPRAPGEDSPHEPAGRRPRWLSGHIPALDGVRGIAVLLVVLFHTTHLSDASASGKAVWWLMASGWTGVDLFFVLSGFLITGILLDAKGQRNYFRNFYVRRSLRIFPLYYAALAVSFLLLPPLTATLALDQRITTQGAVWYLLYLSNFYQLTVATTHPILGVVWSLAIEEQFYLAWPTLVHASPRKAIVRLCLTVAGIALILRLALTALGLNGEATYVVTFCRMDSLAIGALLAAMLRTDVATTRRWLRRALAFALPVIALMIALPHDALYARVRDTIGYTALAIAFAGVIFLAVAADPRNVVRRVCSTRALRVLGKYSYAIYLIHSPLDAILRRTIFPTPLRTIGGSDLPTQILYYAVALGLSLALARVSWDLFEKHFLRLKDYFPYGDDHGRATVPAGTVPGAGAAGVPAP